MILCSMVVWQGRDRTSPSSSPCDGGRELTKGSGARFCPAAVGPN